MADPFLFDNTSPRHGLPLLFAGQAQKEAWINEALSRIDALLHFSIEGELATPPTSPEDGSNWLVAVGGTDEWSGKDGQIACRQGGNWIYVSPRNGMQLLDLSTGQQRLFLSTWKLPAAPSEPTGGSNVDNEARAAIVELIEALRVSGVFPNA